jgi:hypothetical protein
MDVIDYAVIGFLAWLSMYSLSFRALGVKLAWWKKMTATREEMPKILPARFFHHGSIFQSALWRIMHGESACSFALALR